MSQLESCVRTAFQKDPSSGARRSIDCASSAVFVDAQSTQEPSTPSPNADADAVLDQSSLESGGLESKLTHTQLIIPTERHEAPVFIDDSAMYDTRSRFRSLRVAAFSITSLVDLLLNGLDVRSLLNTRNSEVEARIDPHTSWDRHRPTPARNHLQNILELTRREVNKSPTFGSSSQVRNLRRLIQSTPISSMSLFDGTPLGWRRAVNGLYHPVKMIRIYT